MATVLKPKRSNTSSAQPGTADLEVGEIAVNIPDKLIYIRDSAGNVQVISNYLASAPTAAGVFPEGDYGDFSSAASGNDAFGQSISQPFDCLDTPSGTTVIKELGSIT